MSRRWFFKNGPQGAKRHFGSSLLQSLVEPKSTFPNTVMFQLIRVNDTVVIPLPFEATVESGRRMAARVRQEFLRAGDTGIRHVWVASNSNGYLGYTTTPEEYGHQEYEGGHTLYGRNSTPYLTAQLGLLARDLKTKGDVQEFGAKWEYVLKTGAFYPEPEACTGTRRVMLDPQPVRARRANEEDYVRFRWRDVGPGNIDLCRPLARVEVRTHNRWALMRVDGRPINDDGYDLEVRFLHKLPKGMGEYEVRWFNPAPGGGYRFMIEPRGQKPALASRVFIYRGFTGGRDGRAAPTLVDGGMAPGLSWRGAPKHRATGRPAWRDPAIPRLDAAPTWLKEADGHGKTECRTGTP